MRLRAIRIGWLLLALLAAFVIFVECLADIGGDQEPIRQPAPTAIIPE